MGTTWGPISVSMPSLSGLSLSAWQLMFSFHVEHMLRNMCICL